MMEEIKDPRVSVDQVVDSLSEQLTKGNCCQFEALLTAMGAFYRYSLGNVLRIVAQHAAATHVAGFHAWKKLGRRVRKGEKGIAVMAPIIRRSRTTNDVIDAVEDVVLFKPVYVWDISQTEGEESPRLADIKINPKECMARAKMILEVQGLNPSSSFADMLYELSEAWLENVWGNECPKLIKNIEVRAVMCVVSQAIGIKFGELSADCNQLHRNDEKLLLQSLYRIKTTASRIIAVLMEDRPCKHLSHFESVRAAVA